MRAARRLIVLAGILATVVCAPVTWSQAGAQTEGDGETPTATFTFVKFVCADFGLIPANAFERDGLRARPDGTTLGPPIAASRVDPNESGSGCERVPDWPFVLGGPDNVIPNPPSPGNMVDPSMPPLTGTVALTSEQIRLLDNGDLKASEVQQPGFAFGTLRCGTDNRNDDNLEFLGLTENDSLACVAYNVAAPVTISKIVEGSTPKGPFALTVTCGDGESTSYQNDLTLDDGGSQRLWLPYDTNCTLVETATGGADETSFSVNGEAAEANLENEAGPTLDFTTPGIEDNAVAETAINVINTGASADVSLTKTGIPATVAQGAPVAFELTVTNNGPDGADGVELTDTLPSGLTWSLPDEAPDSSSTTSSSTTAVDSESPDVSTDAVDAEAVSDEVTDEVTDEAPSCTIETGEGGAQTLRCDIGQLDADASFSVTVTSNSTTTCGMVTNEDAAVTADTPDPDTENNAASASVGVTCPPPPAPTPAGFIPNGPEETTTTTSTTTTTTTTIPAPPEPQPEPPPPPPPPPPPTVLPTVVVRSFVPPEAPPPPEVPPPSLPPAPRTQPPRAAIPPPDVVLRTVNPSATPGGVLGVTGEGCTPNQKVEFSIDGTVVGETTANADGTFKADLDLPVLDIGRSVLHADCGGTTDTNFDVVLTTSSMPAGSLGMGILFLAILAVIAFAHPLAASKKG